MKQKAANKALLRTSHKVRRPENADVGQEMIILDVPNVITIMT